MDNGGKRYRTRSSGKGERWREQGDYRIYTTGKALIQGRPSSLTEELDSWWAGSHLNRSAYVPPPNSGHGSDANKPSYSGRARARGGVARIGIDESGGKGDYFGPLVAAGVYVDAQTETELLSSGVQDSKRLTDRRIMELSGLIVEICPHSVVAIGPARYNGLYKKMGNVEFHACVGSCQMLGEPS